MMTDLSHDDLLPSDVEPLTDTQVVFITDRLATMDFTLAFYLLGSETENDIFVSDLGCPITTYRRLCLSGLPRDAADIPVMADRLALDADRLAHLFRRRLVPFIGHPVVGR